MARAHNVELNASSLTDKISYITAENENLDRALKRSLEELDALRTESRGLDNYPMLLDQADRKIAQRNAEGETLNRLLSAKTQDYDNLKVLLDDMDRKANLVIAEADRLNSCLARKL